MSSQELSLQDQVLLLCLNDQTGKFESRWIDEGLSAAALGELLLKGRIVLDPSDLVHVQDATPIGDDGVDPALARIARSPAALALGHWVRELKDSSILNAILIPRLIRRGILRKQGERFLWIFGETTYPALHQEPEQELRRRIREVIHGSDPVAEPIAALIGILSRMQDEPIAEPVGALRFVLAPPEQTEYRPRVEQIVRQSPIGGALASALAATLQAARKAPASEE